MKFYISIIGLLLLIGAEISRVYFIMPFPGSQRFDSIEFAYWLGSKINEIRLILGICVSIAIYLSFRSDILQRRAIIGVFIFGYATVYYMFNFKFLADKMFYQKHRK